MAKISAVVITKNEEKNIRRCLDSLGFADEVIIVDSGSKDKTREICMEYDNVKWHETKWLGFGPTKKYAVGLAENDWIFSIDADEEVTKDLEFKIKSAANGANIENAYYILRKTTYLGKIINYCGWQNDYILRLFNRKFGNFNENMVHEFVEHKGKVVKIKEILLHYSYPTIKSHIDKINFYTDIAADEKFEKGKKASIFSGVMHGGFRFLNMYIFNLGFLCGKEGFLLCLISSFGVGLKYFKIWSLSRVEK